MLYPDCNELDPFFIIRTIYQYRYQNPTQYPEFYTNQTYVHVRLPMDNTYISTRPGM